MTRLRKDRQIKISNGDYTPNWIVYGTIWNVIGWLGFIGRLMQFCVEKIVGKRIDLRLDERKRAATSFIRLYNSLQDLDSICAQFLGILEPVVNGSRKRLRNEWVRRLSEATDKASAEFLDAAKEMVGAIQIFDPTLALLLGQVQQSKFIYLSLSSGFDQLTSPVELNTDAGGRLESVRYSAPSDDLETIDFESLYQTMERWGTRPFSERDYEVDFVEGKPVVGQVALEWPKDSLLNLLDGKVVDRVLMPTDVGQITSLYELTQRHLSLLTQTRETLRSFISENFSIDDLLYVFERPS